MGNNTELYAITHVLTWLAYVVGMILCLIYQRLSLRLLIAGAGFGGTVISMVVLELNDHNQFGLVIWIIFTLFRTLSAFVLVFGLGLAFADIQDRLNRADGSDNGDPDPNHTAPPPRRLPADEDLAPWRSNRENDRDFRR
jgi:hypothetical protein